MNKKFEGGLQILVLVLAAVLAALWPLDQPATGAEQEPSAVPQAATTETAQTTEQAQPTPEQAQPTPEPAPGGETVDMPPGRGSSALGRVSFRLYCASCHGTAGKGDGSVARYLKVTPSDLTKLSLANHGRFPTDRVYATIDGRQPVPGHGASDMPVWGMSFQEAGKDADQEEAVRHKIRDLVTFLETIQAKSGAR